MKKIILVLFIMVAVNSMKGQTFDKGTSVLQLGAGFGGNFGTPFGLGYETGISDKIGIGGFVGYSSKSFIGVKVTNILLAAKGNYHFYQTDKLDTYAGAMIGYAIANVSGGGTFADDGVNFGGQIGARYYFTDSIGAFAELGYGIANLNVGIAFKL